MQSWRNTNFLYNEWDQGRICRTYSTIPEKYALPLHGRQWIKVHSQVDSLRYNTKFSKKLIERLDTKECKKFRLLSILYSKPLREIRKPKFKIGDRFHIAKFDLPFRMSYRPQFKKDVFEIVAISSRKLPTYTKKMNKMRLSAVNCIRKSWSTSFNNGMAYNRVVSNSICATVTRQYTQLFYNFFYQSNWIWKVKGKLKFQKYPTH